jgi:three-Cys-motif partner protein
MVEKYLHGFNTALRTKPNPDWPFKRVYIDAFAGTGSFSFLDEMPLIQEAEADRVHRGSARRALDAEPPFNELYFIEQDPAKVASLREVCASDARVTIIQGDANKEVVALLGRLNWAGRRGVIFVDPCGPETDWRILRAIAATKALDMWWLFPISAVYRNAPRDRAALTPDKKRMVARCLDQENWEDDLYKPTADSVQDGLFDLPVAGSTVDRIPPREIEAHVTRKLRAMFPHVEEPGRLDGSRGAQLFSLYFAVSNPSSQAIKAASSIARDLLKKL